jgi:hypothetical protein
MCLALERSVSDLLLLFPQKKDMSCAVLCDGRRGLEEGVGRECGVVLPHLWTGLRSE